jgi:hypothetical protein
MIACHMPGTGRDLGQLGTYQRLRVVIRKGKEVTVSHQDIVAELSTLTSASAFSTS